jgi:hypothetical protein
MKFFPKNSMKFTDDDLPIFLKSEDDFGFVVKTIDNRYQFVVDGYIQSGLDSFKSLTDCLHHLRYKLDFIPIDIEIHEV